MNYNNFGICAQAIVQAGLDGKGHLNSQTRVPGKHQLLESELIEVAVYHPLHTVGPAPIFSDLYSIN